MRYYLQNTYYIIVKDESRSQTKRHLAIENAFTTAIQGAEAGETATNMI
jgi:hypothetical protein